MPLLRGADVGVRVAPELESTPGPKFRTVLPLRDVFAMLEGQSPRTRLMETPLFFLFREMPRARTAP